MISCMGCSSSSPLQSDWKDHSFDSGTDELGSSIDGISFSTAESSYPPARSGIRVKPPKILKPCPHSKSRYDERSGSLSTAGSGRIDSWVSDDINDFCMETPYLQRKPSKELKQCPHSQKYLTKFESKRTFSSLHDATETVSSIVIDLQSEPISKEAGLDGSGDDDDSSSVTIKSISCRDSRTESRSNHDENESLHINSTRSTSVDEYAGEAFYETKVLSIDLDKCSGDANSTGDHCTPSVTDCSSGVQHKRNQERMNSVSLGIVSASSVRSDVETDLKDVTVDIQPSTVPLLCDDSQLLSNEMIIRDDLGKRSSSLCMNVTDDNCYSTLHLSFLSDLKNLSQCNESLSANDMECFHNDFFDIFNSDESSCNIYSCDGILSKYFASRILKSGNDDVYSTLQSPIVTDPCSNSTTDKGTCERICGYKSTFTIGTSCQYTTSSDGDNYSTLALTHLSQSNRIPRYAETMEEKAYFEEDYFDHNCLEPSLNMEE